MWNQRYPLPLFLLLATAACSTPAKVNEPAVPAPTSAAATTESTESTDLRASSKDAASTLEASALEARMQETPPQDPASQLEADSRQLSLDDQRKLFLLNEHIKNAEDLTATLQLEEALREADAALAIDPDNARAREVKARILALRGDFVGTANSISQEMSSQFEIRVQQMKSDVKDALAKARVMVARNDYRGAITELEIANNLVRFAPYSVNWQGLDVEAKTMLEQVKAQRESAEMASQAAAEQKATESLRAQEAAQRERKAAVVNATVENAIDAFQRGDFEAAEAAAKQALERDPRNQQAQEIADAAFRAGRMAVRENYVDQKREQFRRWKETMKEMEIPYTEVITLPDADRWAEITELRSKRRGFDLSQRVDEGERLIRENLRTAIVQVSAKDEESLTRVIDSLRATSGLPLVVDPAAEAAATEGGTVFNFALENKITAEQALNLITRSAGDKVTWTVRHDAVLITTKEKARGKPIIVNHDVQDLIFGLTDFTGPRIDRIRLLDQMQDDDGGGPFGGIGEKPKIIEPGDLATLIQENVAVGTWQDEGVSIEASEGFILISHTPEIQGQVREFLEDLRRFSSSLVTIESKFLTVGHNFIQEIGVDWRGLDNNPVTDVTNGLEDMASRGLDNSGSGTSGQNAAGAPSSGIFYDDGQDGDIRATTQNFFNSPLGNTLSTIGGMTFQLTYLNDLNLSAILRLVEKSSDVELINDQVLSVHNTQRAFVSVINQRAYIQDFDVEVAQFQAVADPKINVLHEGVVLDVRPTIQHNRKYLTLEIQPTVAKVIALRDFSTSLAGTTLPVQFQLPEVEVQSVFTTAIIPDGGSIMLGGLSSVRNIERRAEVPWFAKIPLVGFFFKQEGYNDENRSLMILIRARISDVRDELRRIEATR